MRFRFWLNQIEHGNLNKQPIEFMAKLVNLGLLSNLNVKCQIWCKYSNHVCEVWRSHEIYDIENFNWEYIRFIFEIYNNTYIALVLKLEGYRWKHNDCYEVKIV